MVRIGVERGWVMEGRGWDGYRSGMLQWVPAKAIRRRVLLGHGEKRGFKLC